MFHTFITFPPKLKLSCIKKSSLFFHCLSCYFFLLSVFSVFDFSHLFTSCWTNQEMKLFLHFHSKLLQSEILNSRADTLSLKLLLPGTVSALYHSQSFTVAWGSPPHKNHFMMGSCKTLFSVNSIMQLVRASKSTNLHQHWTILSTCELMWNWFSFLIDVVESLEYITSPTHVWKKKQYNHPDVYTYHIHIRAIYIYICIIIIQI